MTRYPATPANQAQPSADEPRLLVPIAVEALIIGKDQSTPAALTPNFGMMYYTLTLGTEIEPQPFETTADMPRGVHLRWALPDALTHGVQGQAVGTAELNGGSVSTVQVLNGGFGYDPSVPPAVFFSGGGGGGASAQAVVNAEGVVTGIRVDTPGAGYTAPPTVEIGSSEEIRYPQVPNRWFVLRSHADNQTRKVDLKSWVVVSDTLTLNEYGRVAQGTLPKTLEDQLTAGRISSTLRAAMNDDLGLSISESATLEKSPFSNSIWYIRNLPTPLWYSIEIQESDLLVLGNSAVSWPHFDPDVYAWPPFRYIGRSYPYDLWNGQDPAEAELDLTAIGPGDPMFAAAYPNCRSVFGFYDDLKDLPNGGEVTYMVAGWYADPAQNPLWGADTAAKWVERMDELLWCLKQDPGGFPEDSLCSAKSEEETNAAEPVLPTDILCQGMIYGVKWEGPEATYSSGVPEGHPDIAVGNTSVEAISALVANKLADEGHTVEPDGIGIEELLEAFQYEILDELVQPDGLIRLEQELHQHAFGRRPGGTIWGVMPKQSEAAEIREDDTTGTPYPESVSEALTRANTLQADYERRLHDLQDLQWETYSAWFRKAMLDQSPLSEPQMRALVDELFTRFEPSPITISREHVEAFLRSAPQQQAPGQTITQEEAIVVVERLIALVDQEKEALAELTPQLSAAIASLTEKVAEDMSGYEVIQSAGARYWQANDPVVLFARDVERGFAHGADGALADGESLPCRVSGQTIVALTTPVPDHDNQTITQTQLEQYYGSFPAGVPLPSDIEPLFIETLLLDTTMDVLMAVSAWQLAGVADPTAEQIELVRAEIEAIQAAPLNAFLHAAKRRLLPLLDSQKLAEAAGFTGVYPYKLAVDPWSPPWAPIYLEWDIYWNASYKVPAS